MLFLLIILSTFLVNVLTLSPIEIKGYKFFNAQSGEYFAIKGIDYYPRPNDGEYNVGNKDFFTIDFKHIWERDIPFLAQTGANTIRIYAVDPSLHHDGFMRMLNAYGIYTIIDLGASCEGCSITKDNAPLCYPSSLKTRGEHVINTFSKYPNVLAFSAGNEVNHVQTTSFGNAPCQKKFIYDMRSYIASCDSLRKVPIGVVSADIDRMQTAMYYNCYEKDMKERAEWYGLNAYLHCDGELGNDTMSAGYDLLKKDVDTMKYSIPFILSEYGCVNPSFPTIENYEAQRNFYDTKWIFSKALIEEIQGGLVFEYSTENENSKSTSTYPFSAYGPQNYGLGYFKPKDCDEIKIPCEYQPMPNFYSLAKQFNSTNFSSQSSMKEFKVPSDRQAASTCPEGIPSIHSLKWEADSVGSAECPSSQSQRDVWSYVDGKRIPGSKSMAARRVVSIEIIFFAVYAGFQLLRGD